MVNRDVPRHYDDDLEEDDDQEVHDIPNNEEDIDEGKDNTDFNFQSFKMSNLSICIKLRAVIILFIPKCTLRHTFQSSDFG